MYLEKLKTILNSEDICLNELMSKHTTFQTGGPAKVFITPKTFAELLDVVSLLKSERENFFVTGRGSNLLIKDEGYDGTIISINNNLNEIKLINENSIYVEAGCSFRKLSKFAHDNGLSGLEYAYGIPGTVGGAIAMNAGAYGGEVKDNIICATIIDENNKIVELKKEQLQLSYRRSLASEKDIIILSAIFKLETEDKKIIKDKMDNMANQRKEKQPIDKPSAGSTFKRPTNNFAGKLIQDSGLSGYKIGGAMVSTKHCGFIINDKNATSKDILDLIQHVKDVVLEKYGVELELEVKVI